MSNEFKGVDLGDAVRKATAAYGLACDKKDEGRCNDLILEIEDMKREAGRSADQAEDLEQEARSLVIDGAVELTAAAIAALGTVANVLVRFKRILRAIERLKRLGRLTEDDILDLFSLLGPLGAAIGAIHAATQFAAAARLADQAHALRDRAERMGQRLLSLVRDYNRLGCGDPSAFTGA